ncbi:hypothetical protein [Kineococcus sp. SYSU DK005]|uniref:hypothetical protein n=1 Tax=Kineococcus sp. SYSU DK005 TaxID=3383126 RepID=UPI003D7E6459
MGRELVAAPGAEEGPRRRRAHAGAPGPRPDPSAGAAALDEHARALHRRREPWGVSAHDALEALAELAERPLPASTTRRLRGQALTACRREDLPLWAGRVRRAVELGAFDVTGAGTPWAGAQLRTREAAEETLARVRRVVEETLPAARALLATVCDAVGLRGAASVAEATERVELLDGVRTTVARFGPEVFAGSLGDVAAATATSAWRRDNGVRMGVLARWRLRRQARAMVVPSAAPEGVAELHEWLQRARAQRLAWQRVSVREAAPRVPDGLEELRAAVAALRTDLVDLQRVLPVRLVAELTDEGSLLVVPLPELTGLLRSLAADAAALNDLPERTVLLDELAAAGWQPLLDDLGARWDGPGSVDLTAEVECAWWSGVLEALSLADPLVGAPDAAVLRSARAGLQLAEAAARAHDAREVRRAVDARVLALPPAPAERPLRVPPRAATRDPEPLGPELAPAAAVLPCTALSAAAAAALAADLPPADLVVVLGARSTATSWVLPALAHARQVVVVGDPALPGPRDLPTAAAAPADAPQAEGTGAAGSAGPAEVPAGLLDDADGVLPVLRLERQHACLDDRLQEGLVPPGAQDSLPGAGPDPRAVLRTSSRAARGGGARHRPDVLVDLVADVVVDALRRRPAQSLGVVVPDAGGADLLGDAVRRRLADHGLSERGPAGRGGEGLLVACPARWTGERRDHVVVVADAVLTGAGLGAGPAATGDAVLALSRSRARTTLVLDDARWDEEEHAGAPGEPGRHLLLRVALAWEAREEQPAAPATALERRLAGACRALGLPVALGAGRSRRVPLAVRRPDGTGPALAVQLDGPAWAAAGVVEREVTTPARLEHRGWRCVRSLETDVLADPAGEAERIAQRWREAVTEHGSDAELVLDLRAAPAGAPVPPAAPEARRAPRGGGASPARRRGQPGAPGAPGAGTGAGGAPASAGDAQAGADGAQAGAAATGQQQDGAGVPVPREEAS